MLLECDLGNSYCKWRIVDEGGIGEAGVIDCRSVSHAWSLPDVPVARVRAASVAPAHINNRFERELYNRYGLNIEWAVTGAFCAGVTNAYRDCGRLGVDRWLAIVAAYNDYGASVVVDAGSALTVDVVNSDGWHLGGYIAPGHELMNAALFEGTAQVRVARQSLSAAPVIGHDTFGCVSAGVNAAQLGVIDAAIRAFNNSNDGSCTIVLTGGGAVGLAKSMRVEVVLVPDLVLNGLRWLLP